MLRRLHALYLRYASVHGNRLRSVAIGPVGRRCGQIESVTRNGATVEITGWAEADRLSVSWPGGEVSQKPDIPRADVRAACPRLPVETGFSIDIPHGARPLRFRAERSGQPDLIGDIAHPSDPPSRSAHRRLRRAFIRDMVRTLPHFLRHAVHPSQETRTAIKRGLGLEVLSRGHRIDPTWFGERSGGIGDRPITIILPVHNARSLVERCLGRIERNTDLPWHLVLVDDASTEPGLGAWLADWAAARAQQVTLLTPKQNLGFVGAVNLALREVVSAGLSGPVILLNSDAMVPPDWAGRLTVPLSDPRIASVTPMSNDAEILSVPTIGHGTVLDNGQGDALDAVAAKLAPPQVWPEVPTGVGFCMALSPRWLAKQPQLDPAFGRGYGEEVDWCQRIRAMGGRHVCQPGVFVEHVGGQSFGTSEKKLRMRAANAMISRRYPAFDASVQDFATLDPIATPRLALGIALAGQRAGPQPVFLAHTLGGGAEVALMAEISRHPAAVVLRVGGASRWQVELHMDGRVSAGQTDDLGDIRRLLDPVPQLELIYSCGVGDPDPVSLPSGILSLRRDGRGDRVAARIHDYFVISPSYTLLDSKGHFGGVPGRGERDEAHQTRRPGGAIVPLALWQKEWGALIAASHEVTVFSEASAGLLRQAHPDAAIRLRPHDLPVRLAKRPVPFGSGVTGVLGNLNTHKGANILRQMARSAPDRNFVVIGNVDSTIPMPRNVTVHGTYAPHDITDLAARYRVEAWIIPAIWPETFSFVTHEALQTGMPVLGFALGAQGDTLNAAPNGTTVPLAPMETAHERLLAAVETVVAMPEAAE